MYKVKLLTLDKPTANNHIYPREVFVKALEKYQEDIDKGVALVTSSGWLGNGFMPRIEDTVGVVKNVEIVGDDVFVDISMLKQYKYLEDLQAPLSIASCSFVEDRESSDTPLVIKEIETMHIHQLPPEPPKS